MFLLFVWFILNGQLLAEDIRSMKMSLRRGWKFQCANTTCLPFARNNVSSILQCQTACLFYSMCKTISFYQTTSSCEMFGDMQSQLGNMLAAVDTTTMIVIDGTRIPPGEYH